MNYEEAIEYIVTSKEAQQEIEKHSLSFKDFVIDYGNFDTYKGNDVLKWLGYQVTNDT